MKKKLSRLASLFLAFALMISAVKFTADAYCGTVTGCVQNSFGTPVIVETNWHQKATLRICTFTSSGKRTSGKLTVQAECRDGGCRNTKKWNITGCNLSNSSTNVTLPACHGGWNVYIRRNGTSASNVANTCYMSLDFMSNCHPH